MKAAPEAVGADAPLTTRSNQQCRPSAGWIPQHGSRRLCGPLRRRVPRVHVEPRGRARAAGGCLYLFCFSKCHVGRKAIYLILINHEEFD